MINLCNDRGFKWVQNQKNFFKGYGFNINSNYDFLKKEFNNYNEIVNELRNSKGFFSIVYEDEKVIFAAVDRVRSIPLFYGVKNGELFLSDNARWILDKVNNKRTDEVSKAEFYLTGYVTGRDTLYESVKQIQAGEYILFDKVEKKIYNEHYFKFQHEKFHEKSSEELIEELDNIYLVVFNRLIQSLNGRTAVIPLSGGYDSRLIAIMLKRLGYENVICFTYGKENNSEAKISKSVAEKLGYKWVFIPYTTEKWKNWYRSSEKIDYFNYSDGLSSIPHIQDVIAIRELLNNRYITEDAILIPGHSGDFIAGSHIPDYFAKKDITSEKIANQILNVHYSLWDDKNLRKKFSNEFKNKIFNVIKYQPIYSSENAANVYEQWDWSERQSKFICHSVRVYDYYNLEWRLPLWEKELIDFWSKINLENRLNRKLYFKYVSEKQVEFKYLDKNNNENILLKYFKSEVKKFPTLYKLFIKRNTAKLIKNHPLLWFSIIDEKEIDDLKWKILSVNSYLTREYLKNL